jgi:plastocyanin
MKKVLIIVVALLVVGGVAFALMESGGSKSDNSDMSGMDMSNSSDNNTSSSTAPVSTDKVDIKNFAFSPKVITVPVGTTVHWTNTDSVEHTVTSDDGSSDGPNSQQLATGDTYEFKFNKAGTYKYHCAVHPEMTATVIVK